MAGHDRPRSTYLLALVIRKFLERFPGQLTHAGLQVRDGDPFGILEIVQRVQDLFSRVASDVGSSRHVDHERVFGGISLSPVSWPLYACGGRCPGRVCRRLQARAPSWLSPVANVIHAPAIDRQHLGRDEAGIRLDQESHGGGNVLRRANPTDHGALAH